MQALLDGRLFYIKSNHQVVIAKESGDQYALTDVLSGGAAGTSAKSGIRKIGIDNNLRNVLNGAIARLSLGSPDAAVRHDAVKAMYDALTPDNIQRLRTLAGSERDARVLGAIHTALAIADIDSPDRATRLAAIEALGDNLEPEARNRLLSLLNSGDDVKVDDAVRDAARHALSSIEAKLQLYHLAETVFFGLSLGSVLLLSAIGLAITFGVMGVINMAHGELMMIGAYTTYLIQSALPEHLEFSLLLAIPAAFLVAGCSVSPSSAA